MSEVINAVKRLKIKKTKQDEYLSCTEPEAT
jgi:hypothetical protein